MRSDIIPVREAWDAGDYSHFHGWDTKAGEP
jgi:hypothetical protein